MRVLTAFLSAALCAVPMAANSASAAPAIVFEYEDAWSADISAIMENPPYSRLDAKYGGASGGYLIQDMMIPLTSGDYYRMLLTCSSVDGTGGCRGIQISIVDERKTPAAIIQKMRLGDGYAPQILTASDEAREDVMFRAIRAGDNTEAHVYSINPVTGRLTETLEVTRSFPEKMKIDVIGAMREGGIIEAESKKLRRYEIIDLSSALGSLIEDELYQPDGHPIPALRNLRLVRSGWEDAEIYLEDGTPRVDVGMSLVTLSGKPIAEVISVFKKDERDGWTVVDQRFSPSLPYDTE
ncbi:MAG: hypothetical protein LBS53_07155 [Synergistaceae bacterium]|jgi:hypothetical protein|nr:hypothetical protein [Synergistaceae bacterium]